MATSHSDDIDENYVIASPKKKRKESPESESKLFSRKGKAGAARSESSAEADDPVASGDAPDEAATRDDDRAAKATGAAADDSAARSDATVAEPAKKRRGLRGGLKSASRKRLITCGVVVVVVLAAAGVGFWKWHETPSFCGAICHSPMDPYLPTYYSEPGDEGIDKWGNAVSDSSSMLSATHREYADMGCMGCHVPAIQEQVTEGLEWMVGNYYYPLNERDLSRLVFYRGVGETEFCMNSSCHNMTKDDLTEATSESTRNPHSWHHNEYDCSDCHKAHRASVMICSQCHDDYTLPDGWITYQESKELETVYGQYSDFEGEGSE